MNLLISTKVLIVSLMLSFPYVSAMANECDETKTIVILEQKEVFPV